MSEKIAVGGGGCGFLRYKEERIAKGAGGRKREGNKPSRKREKSFLTRMLKPSMWYFLLNHILFKEE